MDQKRSRHLKQYVKRIKYLFATLELALKTKNDNAFAKSALHAAKSGNLHLLF